MAGKTSLKGLGSAGGTGGGNNGGDSDKETFDYLQRFDTAKLASIRANEPEKYQELVSDYSKGVRYKK
jgi:hypothetical protein